MSEVRRTTAAWLNLAPGVFVLACIAHVTGIRNGFLPWDDQDYIYENAIVRRGLTWRGVSWAFTSRQASNWHPLTWLSHMVDVEAFGLAPAGHHAVNIVLHAAVATLLFVLLWQSTGSQWRSAAAASLFAVHPLRVESVAWASERKDVLAMFFWVLSMLAYVRYARGPSPWRMVAVTVLFALAVMSKPSAVTLPCALLLLDAWPLGRMTSRPLDSLPRLLLEKGPMFLIAAASSRATVWAQARALHTGFSLQERLANALLSVVGYLEKTVFPVHLSAYYPFREDRTAQALPLLAAGAVVVSLSAVAVLQRRRRPYLLFGWCWYLGTLVPMLGIVQVGEQAMADRYTYLPSVGIAVALVWLAADWATTPARRRVAIGAAVAAVVVLSAATTRQTLYWHDAETLFTHAAEANPPNWLAEYNVGLERERKGDFAGAERRYRAAASLVPGSPDVHSGMARVLAATGRPAEAIAEYSRAVSIEPRDPLALNGLAILLAQASRLDEAVGMLRRVLAIAPRAPTVHWNLAQALERQGHRVEAAAEAAEAQRLAAQAP